MDTMVGCWTLFVEYRHYEQDGAKNWRGYDERSYIAQHSDRARSALFGLSVAPERGVGSGAVAGGGAGRPCHNPADRCALLPSQLVALFSCCARGEWRRAGGGEGRSGDDPPGLLPWG